MSGARGSVTTVRLLAVGSLVVAGLGVAPVAAAEPVPTCDGMPATIVGTEGPDDLYGTPGPDVVWLGGASGAGTRDTFVDPGGDDRICQGGTGNVAIQAGPGDDWVQLDGAPAGHADLVVYGEEGHDTVTGGQGDGVNAMSRLFGGPGDDMLIGGEGVLDGLVGGAGDDELRGLGGDDYLDPGAGDDQVDAGEGDDTIFGAPGHDTVVGGPGKDLLTYSMHNDDWVSQVDSGLAMDLATGQVLGADVLTEASAIECWIGTTFDDTIEGSAGPDCVDGATGVDVIRTHGGDDLVEVHGDVTDGLVETGEGDDRLWVGGAVEVDAGPGDDHLLLDGDGIRARGGAGADLMDWNRGDHATVLGGPGPDTLRLDVATARFHDLDAREGRASASTSRAEVTLLLDEFEIYEGSSGDDVLRGGPGAETFIGKHGDDLVVGRGGDDVMVGSEGDDTLRGGAGRDFANGGPGQDTCRAEQQRRC